MAHVKIWAQSDYLFTNYSYLSKVTVANFQNNGKIWISCVDKTLPSDVQAKQWIDKCYSDSASSKKNGSEMVYWLSMWLYKYKWCWMLS